MKNWVKKINKYAVMPFSALVYLVGFGVAFIISNIIAVFRYKQGNTTTHWKEVIVSSKNDYESPY